MNLAKMSPWNWFKSEDENMRADSASQARRNDLHPVTHLHQEMDRMLSDLLKGSALTSLADRALGRSSMIRANLDISETDEAYLVKVEIPGVEEKDVEINLRDNVLSIKGQKRQEKN